MRKNRVSILICVLAIGLLTGYPGLQARAETSDANIVFTPGQGPTFPVDPDDPTKPGEGGSTGGSLSIVKITDFVFGEIPFSTGAIHQPIDFAKPHIQVVDLRGGNSGWNITAKLGQFTDSDTQPSLLGAAITIADGVPDSQYELPAPVNATNIILSAGSTDPTEVISAAPGAGLGLWVMRWYPDTGTEKYIHLDIPVGRAAIGTHTATIVWELTDGP